MPPQGASGSVLRRLLPRAVRWHGISGSKARLIYATLEGAQARWQVVQASGTFPGAPVAATTGHLANVGDVFTFVNYNQMRNFRIIRETGVNAALKVTYYR
jgi:hypothetical protein